MRALQAFCGKVTQLDGFHDLGSNHPFIHTACLFLDPKRSSSSVALIPDYAHQTHGALDQLGKLFQDTTDRLNSDTSGSPCVTTI